MQPLQVCNHGYPGNCGNHWSNRTTYWQNMCTQTSQFRLLQVYWGRTDSVVDVMTIVQYGRTAVRIPIGSRDLSPLQNGARPASYSIRARVPCLVRSGRGGKSTIHLHLVSRLRMDGAVPPLPK
jgi:hypothetical protein